MIRKEAPRVGSVHRALLLLKTIIDEGSISVTEAAAALDVNASTAHRLLMTLVHDGFAAQGDDRRYGAGPSLHGPGLSTRIPQVTDRFRPALETLFERTNETVHLAALYGTRILHLDGIEARGHVLSFGLRVGVWLPAHATASGKALLAEFSDDQVVRRYADAAGLASAQRAVVDVPQLLAELHEVRAQRVAVNLERSEPGISALAVALGDARGPRLAISVAVPSARYTDELGAQWSRDLIGVADAVVVRSAAPGSLSRS